MSSPEGDGFELAGAGADGQGSSALLGIVTLRGRREARSWWGDAQGVGEELERKCGRCGAEEGRRRGKIPGGGHGEVLSPPSTAERTRFEAKLTGDGRRVGLHRAARTGGT